MTNAEALALKPGDKVRLADGEPFSFGGSVATVSRIVDEPFSQTQIWLAETGRFLTPGQAVKQ